MHQLTIAMPTPSQKVILTDIKTKWQLIALIVEDFYKSIAFLMGFNFSRKLIVTGEDLTLIEITPVATVQWGTYKQLARKLTISWHSKWYTAQPSQTMVCVSVCVVSGNTDVFVLLLYFYAKNNLTGVVIIESPVKDRVTVVIGLTVIEI